MKFDSLAMKAYLAREAHEDRMREIRFQELSAQLERGFARYRRFRRLSEALDMLEGEIARLKASAKL